MSNKNSQSEPQVKKFLISKNIRYAASGKPITQIVQSYVGDDDGDFVFELEETNIGNKSFYKLISADPKKRVRYFDILGIAGEEQYQKDLEEMYRQMEVAETEHNQKTK